MKILKNKNVTLIVFILIAFFGTFVYKSFRARTLRDQALRNAEIGLQAFSKALFDGDEVMLAEFTEAEKKDGDSSATEKDAVPAHLVYLAKVKELTVDHEEIGYAGFGSGEWNVGQEGESTVARFSDVQIGVANGRDLFSLDVGNCKLVDGRLYITKFAVRPTFVLRESSPPDPSTDAAHDSQTSK